MNTPCIEDYKKVCTILRHIPKRERAKAKRKIKRWTLNNLDPGKEDRPEAMRTYRKMWEDFAAKELEESKKNGKDSSKTYR